jgi:hypothetical protein
MAWLQNRWIYKLLLLFINMVSKAGVVLFLMSVVIGLYFINVPFEFVKLPKFLTDINQWIGLIGGILILIGGFNSLRTGHKDVPVRR